MSFKIEMKKNGMRQLYQQLKRTLDTVNEGYRIKVGILYPEPYDTRPEVDVAQVAHWQNFGTKGQQPIDPRPFMSYSALYIERSRKIKQLIKHNQEMHFSIDENTAYFLGEYAAEIVRKTIKRRGLYQPLAESTIEKKGHDKPLIDQKMLLDSVDYSVHKARQSRRKPQAERKDKKNRRAKK